MNKGAIMAKTYQVLAKLESRIHEQDSDIKLLKHKIKINQMKNNNKKWAILRQVLIYRNVENELWD